MLLGFLTLKPRAQGRNSIDIPIFREHVDSASSLLLSDGEI